MKVGRLVEADAVLCADAASVPRHLLEHEAVVELRSLLEDDVHVEVAVADVPVPQHQGFGLLSQVLQQARPFSHIEGDVVRQDVALLPHCSHRHVFPDLPDFVVLLVVVGHDRVIEALQLLEQRIQVLSGRLDKQKMLV